MPKVDRFTSVQKETSKSTKKHTSDSKQELKDKQAEELAAQAAAAEAEAAAKRQKEHDDRTKLKVKGSAAKATVFSKTSKGSQDSSDDSDDNDTAPQPKARGKGATADAPAAPAPKSGSKKETAADRKKQQASQRAGDLRLLADEQREAIRERVVGRLLRMLVVGFVLDFLKAKDSGTEAKVGKKKGPNSKGDKDRGSSWTVKSLAENINVFGGPFMMVLLVAMIFGARLMEEGYSPDRSGDQELDMYGELGIARGEDIMAVRKAYKALALTAHPDKKTDGCDAVCVERFARITKSYETLSDPEKKKAYDNQRAQTGVIKTAHSIDLTPEDFEAKVFRSSDIWIIQVYNPNEHGCHSFHPLWEETARSMSEVAKFGRIDASTQKRAVDMLPVRVLLTPLVFRFARGYAPENFYGLTGSDSGNGNNELMQFIRGHYPVEPLSDSASALKSFWEGTGRPKAVVTGPFATLRRGLPKDDFMKMRHTMHAWAEFIDFKTADPKDATVALGTDFEDDAKFMVHWRAGDGMKTERLAATHQSDVADVLKEIVYRVVGTLVPLLTVRNYQELCNLGSLKKILRTFCLVLVDASDAEAAKTLAAVKTSQEAYAQEMLDMRAAEDDAAEEDPFHLQVVRITTSSSRWPGQPVAAGPLFSELWSAVNHSPGFAIEMETQKVAAVKPSNYGEIFQQIAYEDLKFKEMPEGFPMSRAMPDPEMGIAKMLRQVLSSNLGALAFYLLLAVGVAVLPELALPAASVSVAVSLALVLVCWPGAMRRCLTPLWCVVASSRFECQLGA